MKIQDYIFEFFLFIGIIAGILAYFEMEVMAIAFLIIVFIGLVITRILEDRKNKNNGVDY